MSDVVEGIRKMKTIENWAEYLNFQVSWSELDQKWEGPRDLTALGATLA